MKQFLRKHAYALWLGLSLGIAEVNVFSFNYWIIVVPTIILVTFRD